jgi:hypothetical protein
MHRLDGITSEPTAPRPVRTAVESAKVIGLLIVGNIGELAPLRADGSQTSALAANAGGGTVR